jgi:hypothetical protein
MSNVLSMPNCALRAASVAFETWSSAESMGSHRPVAGPAEVNSNNKAVADVNNMSRETRSMGLLANATR